MTVAALRRPAGRLTPILSSLSRKARPPFFDLALYTCNNAITDIFPVTDVYIYLDTMEQFKCSVQAVGTKMLI